MTTLTESRGPGPWGPQRGGPGAPKRKSSIQFSYQHITFPDEALYELSLQDNAQPSTSQQLHQIDQEVNELNIVPRAVHSIWGPHDSPSLRAPWFDLGARATDYSLD